MCFFGAVFLVNTRHVPYYRTSSVKELSDEAFGKVTDVSFPVDKIIDCLRFANMCHNINCHNSFLMVYYSPRAHARPLVIAPPPVLCREACIILSVTMKLRCV